MVKRNRDPESRYPAVATKPLIKVALASELVDSAAQLERLIEYVLTGYLYLLISSTG